MTVSLLHPATRDGASRPASGRRGTVIRLLRDRLLEDCVRRISHVTLLLIMVLAPLPCIAAATPAALSQGAAPHPEGDSRPLHPLLRGEPGRG